MNDEERLLDMLEMCDLLVVTVRGVIRRGRA